MSTTNQGPKPTSDLDSRKRSLAEIVQDLIAAIQVKDFDKVAAICDASGEWKNEIQSLLPTLRSIEQLTQTGRRGPPGQRPGIS